MKLLSQAFDILKHFIEEKMRLQHIYQPVFIKTLLENDGSASSTTLAKNILSYDSSQIDYYEHIVKIMPSRVLKNHNIIEKDGSQYRLHLMFNDLTESEIKLLIKYCNDKVEKYLISHENTPFAHRDRNRKPIPGSLRYKILARAKGCCEACGISSDERALDIDHILPKNQGGSNDETNLQVLCYQCNRGKRDADDTDFHKVKESYLDRDKQCIFCNLPEDKKIIDSNELAIAFYDNYPVSKYHTLIIPKRHTADYFNLYQPEINAINQLVHRQKERLKKLDKNITGFNIGINIGEDAGQSIFHVHVHLIPRRKGDMEDPKGGVRGVIPDKQKY